MTAGADTRWSQREGAMSSIRYCDWPGCPSRHATAREPVIPWREFGVTRQKIILCPFHLAGPHLPRLTCPVRDQPVVVPACTCGWSAPKNPHVPAAIREWQLHIESTAALEASA